MVRLKVNPNLAKIIKGLRNFRKQSRKPKISRALDIYWFATMDRNHCDLPSYVEGLLMQRYFEVHGRLPL
jgi:hypothetical protein